MELSVKGPSATKGPKQARERGRWRGRQFLATWAHCPVKNDTMRDFIRVKYGDQLSYVVVCEEEHENVEPHVHAYFRLTVGTTIWVRTLDFVAENEIYHPNIRTVIGDKKDAIRYVKKHDNWCVWGEAPAKANTKEEKMTYALTHSLKECAESGMFTIFEINAIKKCRTI